MCQVGVLTRAVGDLGTGLSVSLAEAGSALATGLAKVPPGTGHH